MKITKQIVSFVMVAVMLLSLIPCNPVYADEIATEVTTELTEDTSLSTIDNEQTTEATTEMSTGAVILIKKISLP